MLPRRFGSAPPCESQRADAAPVAADLRRCAASESESQPASTRALSEGGRLLLACVRAPDVFDLDANAQHETVTTFAPPGDPLRTGRMIDSEGMTGSHVKKRCAVAPDCLYIRAGYVVETKLTAIGLRGRRWVQWYRRHHRWRRLPARGTIARNRGIRVGIVIVWPTQVSAVCRPQHRMVEPVSAARVGRRSAHPQDRNRKICPEQEAPIRMLTAMLRACHDRRS